MKILSKTIAISLAILAAMASLPLAAQPANPAAVAFDEAKKVAKDGPQDIALTGQATLKLPSGYTFIPEPQASTLLNAMGNPGKDNRLQGLIFPKAKEDQWFMTVRYESSGYIKDDDAKDWNADDLLKNYRSGTEEANKERAKMGVPGLEILGWAEKPAYDATSHRLVWAMSSKEIGTSANEPQGVNYNTYALGREGYFSMNLVTGLDELAQHKSHAAVLLAALQFDSGKKYADFNSSTDKVAEYGIAALVAGAAAKKLGLLAVILAFMAKFAKVILIAFAAFGGGIWKFFGSRKKNVVEPQAALVSQDQPDKDQPPKA
jgi:uncharacterized membrane-anchored protein